MQTTGVASTPITDGLRASRTWTLEKRIATVGTCFHGLAVLALTYAVTAALGEARSVIAFGTSSVVGGSDGVLVLIGSCWLAGLFLFLGLFAQNGERWASVAGIALYAVDSLLLLPQHNYTAFLFHLIALATIAVAVLRGSEHNITG